MICAHCTKETDDESTCSSCGQPPPLDGRYDLLEIVGHGAMGTTYRARRRGDGAIVAVKEMPLRSVDSLKSMELFSREAEILRQLDHPGIPEYYEDFSFGEGRASALYLVQEFIDGRTLEDEVAQRRLTERDIFSIVLEILDVLSYLHGLDPPVIHRDIKPSNIMRRDDGSLVLIDFGSVRATLEDPDVGGSTVAGTFGYMAPEQFRGVAVPGSDIYAVGATAIALLSGEEPRDLLNEGKELAWQHRVNVDPALREIVSDMLNATPSERPSNAAALAARIRHALDGGTTGLSTTGGASMTRGALTSPRDSALGFVRDPADEEKFLTYQGYGRKKVVSDLIGIPLVVTIAILPLVLVGGKFMLDISVAMTWIPLFLIFIAAAIVRLWGPLARRRLLSSLYRHGRSIDAVITASESNFYSVGMKGRSRTAAVLGYEFEVEGRTYQGSITTYAVTPYQVPVGARQPVLYLPDDPSKNHMIFGAEPAPPTTLAQLSSGGQLRVTMTRG